MLIENNTVAASILISSRNFRSLPNVATNAGSSYEKGNRKSCMGIATRAGSAAEKGGTLSLSQVLNEERQSSGWSIKVVATG